MPAMKRLLDSTELVVGTCFIDRLSLSYLDGRNCGVDCVFQATGLVYENGEVKLFELYEEDMELGDFLQGLEGEGCTLVSGGALLITNELMELELKSTLRCAPSLVPLFKDIALLAGMECCLEPPEYLKMCYLYQQENGTKAVDELIFDAELRTVHDNDKSMIDFEKDLPL